MGRAQVKAHALAGGEYAPRRAAASCPAHAQPAGFIMPAGFTGHDASAKRRGADAAAPEGRDARQWHEQQNILPALLCLQPPHIPDPPLRADDAPFPCRVYSYRNSPLTLSDRHE